MSYIEKAKDFKILKMELSEMVNKYTNNNDCIVVFHGHYEYPVFSILKMSDGENANTVEFNGRCFECTINKKSDLDIEIINKFVDWLNLK